MARERLPVRRPYEEVKDVRNQAARSAQIRGIVIHTTESHDRAGRVDLNGVRNWFDNPESQASSHVIVDAEGLSVRCVPDSRKAWTVGKFNSQTLNIELIGWAKTPRWQWLKRRRQLKKCAKYVAYWSKKYGIPIRMGAASFDAGHIHKRGVFGHYHLSGPGGHWDPGQGFPFDRLLSMARYYFQNGWPH